MASELQTAIQQLASATADNNSVIPTFPQSSDAQKLDQIAQAFSGPSISNAFANVNNHVNAFLNSPKPDSNSGYAPTATNEQTNENRSAPSLSRK